MGIGVIHFWPWNRLAWVWDITVDVAERGKGYGRALLQGMVAAAHDMGARVLMDFDRPETNALVELYLRNGFRVCGMNDRWFDDPRHQTGIFYGHDL